jgi:hypothetical protein
LVAGCSSGGGNHGDAGSSTGAHADTSTAPVAFLSIPVGSSDGTLVEWGANGQRVRTVRLNAPTPNDASLSPDGTRLLVSTDDTHSEITDVRGKVLVHGLKHGVVWAADSRHLCALQPHATKPTGERMGSPYYTGPADLLVVDPGHGERVVGQFGVEGAERGPQIVRCDVAEGNALLIDSGLMGSGFVSELHFNTGKVTKPPWTRIGRRSQQFIGLSGDGKYAQLVYVHPSVEGRIVDTTTGKTVTVLPGQPRGLSWNGHVALQDSPGEQLRAIDWRTRTTLWRSRAHRGVPQAAIAEVPNSDALALFVPGYERLQQLYLVAGTNTTMLGNATSCCVGNPWFS